MTDQRTIIANVEAEEYLIACILFDPKCLVNMGNISTAHFTKGPFKQLWQAIRRLESEGRYIDVDNVHSLVSETINKKFIQDLSEEVVYDTEWEKHLARVNDTYNRRQIADAQESLQTMVNDPAVSVTEMRGKLQRLQDSLVSKPSQDIISFAPSVPGIINNLEAIQNGKLQAGVKSGFVDLDYFTNGFRNSESIIIASRPSVGKTSIGLNMADFIAINLNTPVMFFSLEMSQEEIQYRLLCSRAKISLHDIRSRRATGETWTALRAAGEQMKNCKLFIDGSPNLSMQDLRQKALKMKERENIGIVFIDYLQLITSPITESRQIQVTYISQQIKALAREIQTPIVTMAQLNRLPEKTKDRAPNISDLRESGAIENDADMVLLLHRKRTGKGNLLESPTLMVLGKQRNGPTGLIDLYFQKEYTKFEPATEKYEWEME
jgi:replicative DNA helicase